MTTGTLAADASALALQYKDALLDDVLPFWASHSPDREHGGYFSCLDRDGTVYDTDKFVWLQAREVWMYSALYNRIGDAVPDSVRDTWLDLARIGADFLRHHGTDSGGNWYFSLTREGKPLVQPYNVFSDCFAAMAFSQYALATGSKGARGIARRAYHTVLGRRDNPKGAWEKSFPGTRPMRSLALPMILANLTLELDWMLDDSTVSDTVESCIDDVFGLFLDRERNILREAVAPDGAFVDSFDGRLVNPGHGIEAMWFMMDIGERMGGAELIGKATDVMLSTLEFGWDREQDGIFYFLDAEGHPPDKLEWDQKLWWVHLETIVALAKGYRLAGTPEQRDACEQWYRRVHAYAWEHFPDPEHGEWFGYLNRAGSPHLPLKGGKWKGCFHVPRALWICWQEFEAIAEGQQL